MTAFFQSLRTLAILFGSIACVHFLANEPIHGQEKAGKRHALLIGCTTYDNLAKRYQLKGPANDVKLLADVLHKRFGFAPENMVTLSEEKGGGQRPVRAHIRREFARLASVAGKGDVVVILLAGHGSQQPDQEPFDEPDGLDETFLPADAGPWDEKRACLVNAIIDDELRAWTKAIADKGAHVLVLVDSCHSGTMLRDAANEPTREVPLRALVPQAVLEKAAQQAKNRTIVAANVPRGVVALYAVQPDEAIPDRFAADIPYGPLTWSVCQVLTQARAPLTYRELAQRVYECYLHGGNPQLNGLIPFAEGSELDREVLGQRVWPQRKNFTVQRDGFLWKITGGSLHGLTPGSILAVHAAATDLPARTHARLVRCGVVESQAEAIAFAGVPAVDAALEDCRAKLVYLEPGSFRLKVAVDCADLKELSKSINAKNALIEWTAPSEADWLIRNHDGKLYLAPGNMAQRGEKISDKLGPYSSDDLGPLRDRLKHIARAANLIKLTRSAGQDSAVSVELTMHKLKSAADRPGERLVWADKKGPALLAGDWAAWRVKNTGGDSVDVTLLFIDNHYEMRALFPRPAAGFDNRLKPGQEILLPPVRVNDSTIGLEHVLLIAVKADGQPADFTCLAQPSERQAEKALKDKRPFDSPLGKLLRQAAYGSGTRTDAVPRVDSYAVVLQSWRVLPRPRQ